MSVHQLVCLYMLGVQLHPALLVLIAREIGIQRSVVLLNLN